MTEVECDVVVLGLGPGGEHVAIKLARAGLDVVGVEDRLVGGECPYYGCVPSKMMIAAAHVVADVRKVPDFGGTATVKPDWATVAQRVRDEATDDWDDAVAVKRLEDSGARFHRGRGVLDGPGRVRVDDTTYVARKGVVLNTGTRPTAPPIDGLEGTPYWTNRDAVAVTELPASLVVLGGGPIGCEFAQVFARFGVDVTVVEMADRLVAIEEPEASEVLEKAFADEGITVLGRRLGRLGDPRRRRLHVARRRQAGAGGEAVGGGGPPRQPRLHRSRHRGPARRPQGRRDRRADARREAAVGDRRHHRARAPSPTCRCTRGRSSCATCWARRARGPTTERCRG